MEYNNQTLSTGLGDIAGDSYDYVNNLLTNPTVILIFVLVLFAYIVLFVFYGNVNINNSNISNTNDNSSSNILFIIVIAFFIILVLLNGLQYLYGMNIIARLKNLFYGTPEVDITVDTNNIQPVKPIVPEILLRPQVYNIPDNNFVYEDAKALCSAYGSRLATYSEVESAYNNGGEWCNYGWSDGQMALYPTQTKTFNKLQKIKGHENDCGRPGINGGYMVNPSLKFGVNCFGHKPRINSLEEDLMANEPIYPKTEKDIAMENRVNYWKDKLSDIIVSPFNHNTWSRI
jgi:hypothetical protein